MMPAGKPKDGQPKRRSLIVEAFNPHIGNSIRPIGQSFNLIVNLIAIIFAGQGLFPRNHPTLTGEPGAPKLYLRDVFATAWSNLSFTKEGLPKVLVFFAVIGSIGLSIFAIFSVLMSLMMGTAHAQGACPAQGCFTPANTTNDLGYNLINFLFGTAAQQTTAYTNINTNVYSTFAGGVFPNTNIQTALAQGLALYSGAMLIFAAIILFYHLASMVVDTAHSGVTMGKRANQIWAPIRLVAAVVLLVPIAGGLNSGQLIVLKMAQWGSGLASNVWDTFKVQLTAGVNGGYAMPGVPDVSDTVINIAKMAACEYAYNYNLYQTFLSDPTLVTPVNGVNPNPDSFVNGWSNGWAAGNAWNSADPQLPNNLNSLSYQAASNPPLIETTAVGTIYHFQPNTPDVMGRDLCGSITIPAPPSSSDPTQNQLMNSVYTAQIAAFNSILPQIMHYGTNEQQYLEGSGNTASQGNINTDASGQSISNIIYTYQSALNSQIAAQVGGQAGMTDKYLGVGWMGAGAFFNQVSNVQAAIQSAATNYIPGTKAPSIEMVEFSENIQNSIQKQDIAALPAVAMPGGGACSNAAFNNWANLSNIFVKDMTVDLVKIFLGVIDQIATDMGVWCHDGVLGIRFTGSAPLNQMAAWGHQNMDLGITIFNVGGWLMIAGGMTAGDMIGRGEAAIAGAVSGVGAGIAHLWAKMTGSKQAQQIATNLAAGPTFAFLAAAALGGGASTIGEFLMPAAALFMTLGFLFGYMLPLLPFMHFMFGCVSWLALLFEAVVAMPLVALAHITPEGDGLPGPMARTAYFMAFSILLRPVLMIFGLICGFMTLMLATSVLNIFFAHAMSGPTAQNDHVLTKIIYTIIYGVILISIANHAFQLITILPDKIMSWINAAGARGEKMGDPGSIQQQAAVGAAYLDTKAAASIGNAGSQFKQGQIAAQTNRIGGERAAAQQGALNTLASDSGLNSQRLGSMATNMDRMANNQPSPPPPPPPPPPAPNFPEPSSGAGGSPVSQSTNIGSALRDRDAGGGGGGNTGGGAGIIIP